MRFVIEQTRDGWGWKLMNGSRHVAMSCKSFTRKETCERAIEKLKKDLHLWFREEF